MLPLNQEMEMDQDSLKNNTQINKQTKNNNSNNKKEKGYNQGRSTNILLTIAMITIIIRIMINDNVTEALKNHSEK